MVQAYHIVAEQNPPEIEPPEPTPYRPPTPGLPGEPPPAPIEEPPLAPPTTPVGPDTSIDPIPSPMTL